MYQILQVVLLSFLYVNSANADLRNASNAISRGDYKTAVAEYTKLAEKGNDIAQANLGYMYYSGEGVPQDYKEAVYWHRKAGVQGNKDAQYNLAISYAFGEGVAQNLNEAVIWYRRAAMQGHVVSQYSLGISYAYGEGVSKDQVEAARWFFKAASQGYARAQVQLGSMHHTGEGVTQNYSEAARWYRLAADRGDATAQYNLGSMYRSGNGVEQNHAQAKRWFRQSADQGYTVAKNELASLERSAGANVSTRTIQEKPEDYLTVSNNPSAKKVLTEKAKFEPAKEENFSSNQTTTPTPETKKISKTSNIAESVKKYLFSVNKKDLLTLNSSPLDIPKQFIDSTVTEHEIHKDNTIEKTNEKAYLSIDDPSVEPLESHEDIATSEIFTNVSQEAQTTSPSEGLLDFIGSAFSSEQENRDNLDHKLEQLNMLATQGDKDAQYKLGSLYYFGNGVKKDFFTSSLWYRRAAQQGNADAQYNLGNMYLLGEGIQKNEQQANYWYTLAAANAHIKATNALIDLQKPIHGTERLEIEKKTSNLPVIDTTGEFDYEKGLDYAFGDGVPQNDRGAFNLFYAAAEKNYSLAQYRVGVAYAYGEGVRQDTKLAAEWYQKAAAQGHTIAQRNLAMMYLYGNGLQKNKVHALAWYNIIASQGNVMDIRRRDILQKEFSQNELAQSEKLSNEILNRLNSNTSL
jgi:TPR repeat protein